MGSNAFFDTPAAVARAAAERIRWEMELGAVGYAAYRSVPEKVPESKTATAYPPVSEAPQTVALEAPSQPSPATPQPLPILKDAPPPSSVEDPAVALDALCRVLSDCTRCNLHRGRTNVVFGEGNPHASLVFVGEGPGRDEDLAGRPFVGAAGQLLDRIIEAMGLKRKDVYICNVVKCRPPENRKPEDVESAICGAFLKRQLAVIQPKVLVALGSTAASYLLGGPQSITRIRGTFHYVDEVPMMPTFHPAYLLRNPAEKRSVWNDMQQVMGLLGLEKKSK